MARDLEALTPFECPECGHEFAVPDAAIEDEWLECPECGADVATDKSPDEEVEDLVDAFEDASEGDGWEGDRL